ncbi:MAG TPA: hypothetical protein VK564_10925 [Thermodesulfobacteriota bacterium]|nr:hypothetical protein [Thermodesulfobacteriota bacterium]
MRKTGKFGVSLMVFSFLFTTTLQIRLSHDNKKGYSYNISGPSLEEVLEADQKMRQYLKSLAPRKSTGLPPLTSTNKKP